MLVCIYTYIIATTSNIYIYTYINGYYFEPQYIVVASIKMVIIILFTHLYNQLNYELMKLGITKMNVSYKYFIRKYVYNFKHSINLYLSTINLSII